MAEHERRAKGRALLNKTGYGSAGGHLTKHPGKYASKHDIVEAIHEHDSQKHSGTKKTRVRLAHGGIADGMAPRHRGDRKSRGGKKSHTTVNVLVGHGGSPAPRPPLPVPVPVGGPVPPGGPPIPAPGLAGAGPMPGPLGQKHGGRSGYKRGGKTYEGSKADLAEDKRMAKKHGMSLKEWEGSEMDRKMDREHHKKGGHTGYPIDDGAGGGLGRLEKAKAYGAPVKKGGRAK